MEIAIQVNEFNIDFIYFGEQIKNNIINDGFFIRIFYSSPDYVINGIHLICRFTNIHLEKYFNKYKYNIPIDKNKDIFAKINFIEQHILKKINIKGKIAMFKLSDQIKSGYVKIFNESLSNNNELMLKISGVWESKFNYGITFRFQEVKNNGIQFIDFIK